MASSTVASSLKVGDPFPDGEVVVMEGNNRQVVKMSALLSGKDVIIFIPSPFMNASKEIHLPSFNTPDWQKSGYKIHCISTDTILALEAWIPSVRLYDRKIHMVSNCNRTFCPELLFDDPTLGNIFKRATVVVENGLITVLDIEEDASECSKTHGTFTLRKIQAARNMLLRTRSLIQKKS